MKITAFTIPAFFAAAQLAAAVTLYPAGGGANPRVPAIPPAEGGAKGKCATFENVSFTYSLLPHFRAGEETVATFYLRDLPRRAEKAALVLTDAQKRKLEVIIPAASAGRGAALRSGKETAAGPAKLPAGKWTHFKLTCGDGRAVLEGGGKAAELPLPAGFAPVALTVYAAVIDELALASGGAAFELGWENGYAAKAAPSPGGGGVTARFHGFDNFAVGTDPAKRDCPVLQLSNSGGKPARVTIDYALKSEVGRRDAKWSETAELAPGEERIAPVKFPFELKSDICHLTANVSGDAGERTHTFHFFRAEPRGEKPGPGLFGLHDADVKLFGFWPDALPLRFAHKYLRWGYVVGPAWVRDWNGGYGLDPDTPAAEWNWNEKIDWELASGRELYVCLYGTPLLDWQRARPYPKMRKHPWGWGGGFPELRRYGEFVRAAGERYKGRVRRWEIENEPNASGHMPDVPEDYAELAKVVARELHAADRDNTVYGISGTSTFVPWMAKTLDRGAVMDAVSWHTYTTPRQPDQAGLSDMLEEAKKVARKHKINRFINSETGVLCVMRYKVDEPIAPAAVAEKIAESAPGFVSKNAWPGKVNDEYRASASMVKNAALNLLAGAEGFVFFGWNPAWPKDPETWLERSPWFSLFGATAKGERTPNLLTLAVGVLTAQFEGVLTDPAPRGTGSPSVQGGIFRKADGGEVALLWSAGPTGSVLLDSPEKTLELVTLYGERSELEPLDGGSRYLLGLSDMPVYIHAKKPGMKLLPSPVDRITVTEPEDGKGAVRFTLLNREAKPWNARIRAAENPFVKAIPAEAVTEIAPKKRRNADFRLQVAPGAPREIDLAFTVELPGGGSYACPVRITNKPSVAVSRIADGRNWRSAEFLKQLPGIALDQVEQAVVGRPPKLASLQEDTFWGGPEELSGTVRLAYDGEALYVKLEARDANLRLPQPWPGTLGSCLELFLDFRRPGEGLGSVSYGDGVYQFLAHPETGGVKPELHSPQMADAEKRGVELFSAPAGKEGYVLTLRIPWKAVTEEGRAPETFGFDLGLNGPYPDRAGRKTQLMLYGTPLNFRSAADFGRARTR